MPLAAGGGETATRETEWRERKERKRCRQTASRGDSRLVQRGVLRDRKGVGTDGKTALSAKILSHSVCLNIHTHRHLFHLPASHSYSSPCLCCTHPSTHYASIHHLFSQHPSFSHFRPSITQNNSEQAENNACIYWNISYLYSILVQRLYVLRYLCVGLVVLAVVSGGISAVWSCGCSRGAVGEGAGALGDDGSNWGAVQPRASLSSLGFTPHRPWAAEEGDMKEAQRDR